MKERGRQRDPILLRHEDTDMKTKSGACEIGQNTVTTGGNIPAKRMKARRRS